MWQNSFEVWFVVSLGIFALITPSIVAASYFLLSHVLLSTMTMNLHRRIFWGLVQMGVMSFVMLSLIIWKIRKVDTMITSTTDYEVFKSEVKFYECLGFYLKYTSHELDGSPNSSGNFTFEPDMAWSFMFEIFQLFLIISTCQYFVSTKNKVRNLTKPTTIENLNKFQAYQERLEAEAEAEANDGIGTEKKIVRTREE